MRQDNTPETRLVNIYTLRHIAYHYTVLLNRAFFFAFFLHFFKKPCFDRVIVVCSIVVSCKCLFFHVF